MKPILHFNSTALLCASALIFSSCSKSDFDFDKIKSDNLIAEWGLPLVQSKLTLADFLNDTSGAIHTNPDGLISLIYESKDLFSIEAWERTKIPDQHKVETENFQIPEPPVPVEPGIWVQLPALYFYITFDLANEGQRIDSLYLTNGQFDLSFLTNLDLDSSKINLTVPDLVEIKNNNPLFHQFIISNPEGNTLNLQTDVNLLGYFAKFENNPLNTIIIRADVWVKTEENFQPLQEGYYLTLTNDLTNIAYSRFYGYIGHHTESYSDTINLDIYNSVDFGSISFGPGCLRLKASFNNELGLPVKVEAEEFTAFHTTGTNPESVDIYLFGQDTASSFNIYSPECNAPQGFVTARQFDHSNIIDALNISPNKVLFKLNGIFNYEGDNTEMNCFHDTSQVSMKVSIEMDLFGSISDFSISDTIDFSLEDTENLNAVEFWVKITNGFPITATSQLTFVDSLNNELYSLFPNIEEIIVSAVTGPPPECRVLQPATKETFITIDGDALESIIKADKIIFRTNLSTENDKLIKIYSDYCVDMNMSAKLNVNY